MSLPQPVAAAPQQNTAPARAGIHIAGLQIHYAEHTAINNVCLDAPVHQITALVGPSGCGKSSLLAAINRMTDTIPGCRVEGDIQIAGQSVMAADVDVNQLRRRVGMVFQRPNPFPLSIADNILFPLKDHGWNNQQQRQQRLQEVLETAGLWHEVKGRLSDSALRLSGGQQQRLCLARALALEPQVLLLDEPCSALDPIATEAIERLLVALKPSVTMLMVTHNLGQARRIADHVAVCWTDSGCGYVVEAGSAGTIFNNPISPLVRDYCLGNAG